MAVCLVYRLRRVNCPTCGVTAETVPWAQGKERTTKSYQWFLARLAKRLSWQETATVFHTSWDTVYRAVTNAVIWGLLHRSLDGILAVGVDEIQWKKGDRYLTLVYQIDAGCKRLLWIGAERTRDSFEGFFATLGAKAKTVRFICSDMSDAYVGVIAKRAGQAMHILDRFHIMAHMNKAIYEIRRDEAKRLKRDGYEHILKHSRWCLLKRPENLTEKQTVRLKELLRYNLGPMRAYLLREEFQRFWTYKSTKWAKRFVDEWCKKAMNSRVEPMKKGARMLRKHEQLLLNWIRAKGTMSSGVVEGLNYNAKSTMKNAYGYRTLPGVKIALYHHLAQLPEPEFTHEFC